VLNLVLLAAAILSASRFLGAPDTREMLLWGAAAMLCIALVLATKVWHWLEMLRLSITWDVKRLELRVSHLAEHIGGRQE
jgi:hypothetical protein